MSKRPDGTLENEILQVLWSADEPLTPGEVQELLPVQLAYTSVATVLGRLLEKDLVRRRVVGRGYGYVASMSEAQFVATRVGDVLAGTSDRTAALTGFVMSLSKRDAARVRSMLNELAH